MREVAEICDSAETTGLSLIECLVFKYQYRGSIGRTLT